MDSRKGRVGGLLQKSVTKKSGPPDPTADPIHPDFSMDSRKDRPRTDPTADPKHPDFSMDSRKGRVGGFLQKSVMIDHDFCKKSGPPQILLQILNIQILVWIQILLQILYDRSVARITGKKGSADLCTKP